LLNVFRINKASNIVDIEPTILDALLRIESFESTLRSIESSLELNFGFNNDPHFESYGNDNKHFEAYQIKKRGRIEEQIILAIKWNNYAIAEQQITRKLNNTNLVSVQWISFWRNTTVS
jgi:hypothetical protein